MWFGGDSSAAPFTMFSFQHGIMIALLIGVTAALYKHRREETYRKWEISIGMSLIMMEVSYQTWLFYTGNWHVSHALPLELSNISVLLVILLLLTRNRLVFEIVFLVGISGALQAIITPVLSFGWPHFRFWHFFYTHLMVIWVVFYFLWYRHFPLTLWSVLKAMVFLNVLLPFIYFTNVMFEGNYWFIKRKPAGGSLLDFLGPHPWYILSMEVAAFVFFMILWILFGNKKRIT
ncbi:TIGR02206 family membrane protein [Salipaludibacillus keqinensis]|uniref:TIGR02206 family membrane protein n=1 Tax=Salipaludibacillus keqinensis TaxID=2045207 RepID=A0A323T7W3_9BACI|nr:TIGR02206 family membrane protein [Salipaludibacillus keqinensis]PYZ91992.1 TIGR02206 family membrane protein [Salipaludibacillus keqinensis]